MSGPHVIGLLLFLAFVGVVTTIVVIEGYRTHAFCPDRECRRRYLRSQR
jgi:hypothetical protein